MRIYAAVYLLFFLNVHINYIQSYIDFLPLLMPGIFLLQTHGSTSLFEVVIQK
jgi:hypothetical protein